ncbi:hypothetical protein AAH678_06440 [Sodalis endosymbiont of Spalangia cameroni]|uniref:hypothetical protein n=1 Tax=Sodalis praecaptivus TaxID=1239307 RepID=UPI0031F8BEDB
MSIAIKTSPFLPFNRTISSDKIARAINSDNKADAMALNLWDKIKDWFCGTKTCEVLEKIFVITHGEGNITTQQALSKVIAFHQLQGMAYPIHDDKFHAVVTSNGEGSYRFSFAIAGVMKGLSLYYGKHEGDIRAIQRHALTNDSEFLLPAHVGDKTVGCAISSISYDKERNEFNGVSQANQGRLSLHLLSDAAKDRLARHPELAQAWVSLQMKTFDFYARLCSDLEEKAKIAEINIEEAEEHWLHCFARSLKSLYQSRNEMLANELNDNGWKGLLTLGDPFCDKPLSHQSGWGETMYAEPVYVEPADAFSDDEEPLYAEPVNAISAFEEPLYAEPVYAEPAYSISDYDQPLYAEPASIGRGENQLQRSGSPTSTFVSPRNNLHENRGDNQHNVTGHNDDNLAANLPPACRQSDNYYHGPLNGDIYAKIDKLKTGKTSSLLEEIISEVRVNEAKFPLLAAYVRKHNMI